jgi:hypothetical protein
MMVRFRADPRVDVIAASRIIGVGQVKHTRVTSKTEVLSDAARRSGRGRREVVDDENSSVPRFRPPHRP